MQRTASAVWKGGLQDGNGTLSTQSGVLASVRYSFTRRFGDEAGTNPEELIAAAHAGCFSMALSGSLGRAGITASSIETTAAITFEKEDAGWTLKRSHLTTRVAAPGADAAAVQAAAEGAKKDCPVSRALGIPVALTCDVVA
jgi:osmotically inducible protein OsmC